MRKIAPSKADYLIIAQVSPDDIDGVMPGAEAPVSFAAFQLLGRAPAKGEFASLSRDRVVDPVARTSHYEARVRLDASTLPQAQRDWLVAGMAAPAILPTGKRTALNYLVEPLTRRLQSAIREE